MDLEFKFAVDNDVRFNSQQRLTAMFFLSVLALTRLPAQAEFQYAPQSLLPSVLWYRGDTIVSHHPHPQSSRRFPCQPVPPQLE
jgi:hypothetical protein